MTVGFSKIGWRLRTWLQDTQSKTYTNWLKAIARGRLPPQLEETASKRLTWLSLVMIVVLLLFFALFFRHGVTLVRPENAVVPVLIVSCLVVLSLIVFLLARRKSDRESAHLVLNLGLVYQVAVAFMIGVITHLKAWDPSFQVHGWSGVAVWLIIFAIMVPNTPVRTLIASTLSALMDFVGLLIGATVFDTPQAPPSLWPRLFIPTGMAVLLAWIASRLTYRMAKEAHTAREAGSYHLMERLGKGGMGEVWLAEHKSLARPAAIKIIREQEFVDSVQTSDAAIRQFMLEAEATALLESEHTVRLYDFGISSDGSFFSVMELLDGIDLKALVEQYGPVVPERVVHFLIQVCDSLAEAHHNGLVHRDIKPGNIVACRRTMKCDLVKVLDFGLVVASERVEGTQADSGTTEILGTPAYMAPEAFPNNGSTIDDRTDIYALGCVSYWLLTGQPVFPAQNPADVIRNHLHSPPIPASMRVDQEIPVELERIVHWCLEKDPQNRPQSALDLANELSALDLENQWTQARAKEWWEQYVKKPTNLVSEYGSLATTANCSVETTPLIPHDDAPHEEE